MTLPFVVLKHKRSLGAIISLVSATTACQDVSPPGPTEDVDACDEEILRAAELALEQNCHQCHGQNGTANGSMNFIMDAEQLVAQGLVIPGEPDGSRIHIRMAGDTMPPLGVSPRPDDAARESVRKWIECGAPSFGETGSSREFVSSDEVLSALQKDLEQQALADQKYIRYLSLVNLHNDPSVSDDSLSTYRHGLNKQVNDVSWGKEVVLPESIDDRGILYRIDIRDYGWQAEGDEEDLWELMAREYPYGVYYPEQTDAAFLYEHTTSLVPVMNADFFVFAASEPPLYYDMLRLPPTIAEWKQFLGVGENVKVWTAGVVDSGVSTSNRIVRRLTSSFGVFWESDDFATSIDNKNILSHPLAPNSELPDEFSIFEYVPDGGEFIFSLPNGLHGYAITNDSGVVIDQAPPEIVFDRNDPFDPHVRSGRKCAKCHVEGINPVVDDVLDYVTNSPPDVFPQEVIAKVVADYPTVAEFAEHVAKDRADFLVARTKTGIPTNVEGNDSVPISFLADSFQASMDIDRAAADFGLPVGSLRAMIEGSPDLHTSLGPLLRDGGDIKRELFRAAFPDAVCAMGLGQPIINGEIVICDVCGDGAVTGPEACDDANDLSNDGCLSTCVIPGSCLEVLDFDDTAPDGPYLIAPADYVGVPFPAWCDMTTDGGGWTLAMNLDTSDGHVMWWGNAAWTDGSTYGSVSTALTEDHISPAWNVLGGANQILVVVHQEGVADGWKSFFAANGVTMAEAMQGGDNVMIGTDVNHSDTAGIWVGEVLVKNSTQLYVNHCVQFGGSCTSGATGSPDGNRIGSNEAAPSDNVGGGLGNWSDMNYCCNGNYGSGKGCEGSAFRTVSEAQAGWGNCFGGAGYFGSDTFAAGDNLCGNANCQMASWAGPNGQNLDYAIYLR